MSKQAFDRENKGLEALRSATDAAATRAQLAKALNNRNNYLVSNGAAIAAELKCEELIPDLLAAFERFFIDAMNTDPQCLAKNAIAKALNALGHHGAEPYVRGTAHFSIRPTWGGRADTAATLRGTCALALTDCQLDDIEILTYLADGLADPDKSVRVNSAIAIDQLSRLEGALPLRLKLLTGDPEPDVVGQCSASFLSLGPKCAVAFVSRFLRSEDANIQLEAAGALAQSRDPEAIDSVKEFWQDLGLSLDVRRVVLINMGASPVRDAAEFLLSVVSSNSAELASSAITALATSRFHAELRERIAVAVNETARPDLRLLFEQKFGRPRPDP
jgi:hypothetical protein